MNLSQISITFLLIYFLITSTTSITGSTHFAGDVSINCGSTRASAARNGRQWFGDMQPKLSPMLQISGKSTTSTPANKLFVDDPVPYKTARISRATFSYTFQVGPGQRIIRLHFNPSLYKKFREYKDLFTVQSGRFTLLSNFSASLTADALAAKTLAKEFCLTIQGNEELVITFSPESTKSLDTYAFVNGIEIAALPTALSYFHRGDIGFQVVGEKSVLYGDNDIAFEIIQRHIIKHYPISLNGDFDTMFPKWVTQEVEKKKSSTSTWNIPVGIGFRYLVRLHFSDVGLKIAGTGELKFTVLINDKIAQTNSDILTAGDENYIVLHRDYIVTMRGLKTDGKRDISISILSYDEFRYSHGVLAGFEIVKLSNLDNSLASPNPLPPPKDSPSKSIPYLFLFLGQMNASASLAIALLSLINIIVYKLRFTWEASRIEDEIRLSDRAERLFRHFSPSEIQLATENFYDGHIIGKGGFGNVYKGIIDNGQKVVAAKRLKSNSSQGAREFLNEIEVLSELQHINLVSLIGYCKEKREMILVYEYMPNGTLGDHLYRNARRNRKHTLLTWKQRLNICIEAGRGLEYLHTGHRLIHRDVKAANILLDENFTAKVSDFGLAKREDRSRLQSHVSTKVKGTYGYFDPYYMKTQRLTRKSDTYAFGVVLFETLCGRPAVDSRVPQDERVLTIWVRHKINKGEVDEIVDSRLSEKVSPESLKTFVEIADKCLHDEPKNRPTMAQVVLQLGFALEQQENIDSAVSSKACTPNNSIIPSAENAGQPTEASQVMQTGTYLPAKQTNQNNSQAVSEELSKPKKYNRFRFRTWRPFWRRPKPSDPKEFSLTPADTNMWNFNLQDVAVAANQFSNLCRIFSLHEIKIATHNFDDNLVIGRGGYGNVYKGLIKDGASTVAIKRLSSSSQQGTNEFLTEIQVLGKLRHRNLVSLIGYCHQNSERILVYDYMAQGTLREHLYGSVTSPLGWRERLQICLQVAIGLDYLHTGAEQAIIHRDVKSTNILLDENWVAKIHDFGLSKVCPSDSNNTHVTTMVKGTFGYLDPEYFRSNLLTVMSDVYSFGVLLFEVLCARQPIIPSLPTKQANLIEWGISCFRKGELDQIIDSNLKGQIAPECLNKFVETAVACLREKCIDRPVMRDVIKSLESAVQLQEAAAIDEDLRVLEFDPSTIAAATNQFSSSNKIGEGIFASIYKAVLPKGMTVAVKRFPSSYSCLDNKCENEILLASSLCHQNIIKLLGHCFHDQRVMLFYEFMENGSLDKFIPDELRCHQLQWSARFKVIIGIAKGVIYLHQESRLKIIHRNLNLSNILLDNEMNPKISGFHLARNIKEDQSESSTITTGSFDSISPDHITQEGISEKVDVYSFGVLVLEILTGKRHNGRTENLIDYARELEIREWMDVTDLVDDALDGEFAEEEALRCIQVGLVCTQRDPQQRPTMYSALKMLIGEDSSLLEKISQTQLPPNTGSDASNWATKWQDYDSFNPRAS